MLTIQVKVNGRVIAMASVRNISDLADASDYLVCWNETGCAETGVEDDYNKFTIKDHRRRQSAWALVAKVVCGILGQMTGQKEGMGK
jgi:hypothetical protein